MILLADIVSKPKLTCMPNDQHTGISKSAERVNRQQFAYLNGAPTPAGLGNTPAFAFSGFAGLTKQAEKDNEICLSPLRS